jgi:hypothetical protein
MSTKTAAPAGALQKLIEQRPWIAGIDTDEPDKLIVTLHEPWCFAADKGCGVRGFATLKELRAGTRASDVYERKETFEKVETPEVITAPVGEAFTMPADAVELVMGIANKKQAEQAKAKGKPGRKSMLSGAKDAVAKGQMPDLLEFNSAANYTYNRHAEHIYLLAQGGDLETLVGLEIKGSNTYSKALRNYRDLMVAYLKGQA